MFPYLQVLVLLDTQPSQEMLDEGVARAVVNLVQKLRKKVSFVLLTTKLVFFACISASPTFVW